MNNCNSNFIFSSGLEMKNRMLLAPLTTSNGTAKGGLSDSDCEFLLHRSRDFGAIILGSHSISIEGSAFENGWNIYDHANHESLASFVKKCHQQNNKVFIQIYHAGRLAQPRFIYGNQPVAPSRVKAERKFASFPRELSNIEIEDIIEGFRQAVRNAITLGFDGVELHGANTYLIQQFYSPHSNKRSDEWGGNRKARMKFPLEVINACREVIDQTAEKPFVLGYRFSPEEYETPGIRLRDTGLFLKEIAEKCSIDYLHISIGNYNKLSLEGIEIIKYIRQYLPESVPLIGCGGIQTDNHIKEIMKLVPLFSVANAAIIDPQWASKIINEEQDIKGRLSIDDRARTKIPKPLWNMLLNEPLQYFHPKNKTQLLDDRFAVPLPLREK